MNIWLLRVYKRYVAVSKFKIKRVAVPFLITIASELLLG